MCQWHVNLFHNPLLSFQKVNHGSLKPFEDSEIKGETESQTEMWEDWEPGIFKKVGQEKNSG